MGFIVETFMELGDLALVMEFTDCGRFYNNSKVARSWKSDCGRFNKI